MECIVDKAEMNKFTLPGCCHGFQSTIAGRELSQGLPFCTNLSNIVYLLPTWCTMQDAKDS